MVLLSRDDKIMTFSLLNAIWLFSEECYMSCRVVAYRDALP